MVVFQLTTSRRGRQESNRTGQESGTKFQLTTSRRGRRCPRIFHKWQGRYFNSRPHEEVDVEIPCLHNVNLISTHDLTKRSTVKCRAVDLKYIISTHDLTKRSTYLPKPDAVIHGNFNSRPHEEVDRQERATIGLKRHFNSRPHEEVDIFLSRMQSFMEISTHDLTKRSTVSNVPL